MIAIILIVVGIGIFIFAKSSRGLRFEEECAAQIQEQYFRFKSQHISIGEARLRLRTIVHLLSVANQQGPDCRYLSLRTLRQSAVAVNTLCMMGREPEDIVSDYLVALKKRL